MSCALLAAMLLLATPGDAVQEAPDLDTLWANAILWEVGSNSEKVASARKDLIAHGDEAVAFLVPQRLNTKDTLVTRALEVVIGGIGKSATLPLVACLESENPDIRRNAASLLGVLCAVEASPAIAKLLSDPDTRMGALSALGALGDQTAVPQVVGLLESDAPQRVRFSAASTLGLMGGRDATAALVRALSSDAAVRYASQYALEKLRAVSDLRASLASSDLRVRLHAISALGHIADPAARADLVRLLNDASPVVRGFAAEALGSVLDDVSRKKLRERIAVETHPFARGRTAAALGE